VVGSHGQAQGVAGSSWAVAVGLRSNKPPNSALAAESGACSPTSGNGGARNPRMQTKKEDSDEGGSTAVAAGF